MDAYEKMMRHTSRPDAPWYVIPADRKWFAQLATAAIVIDALERLPLDPPKPDRRALEEMERARASLLAEAPRAAE
ncbi:Polyphosphate kinase 2 [compost metagenome]